MINPVHHKTPVSIQQAIAELGELRKTVLALPPEKAMDVILNAPQPAALVHSIPETDLYFLVQDIGTEDSLPILSLASNAQWEFMLDMAVWKVDRFENRSLTRWLHLRFLADPDRFLQWFENDEREFVEWYLFKNIQVRMREPDEDPSDFPDAFMSLDNEVFFRLLPESDEPIDWEDESADADEDRYSFITALLEKLSADDPIRYMNVMMEIQTILPAETEEEAWRLRNVRMAERGFLPFDEAIGVYQPLKPGAVPQRIVMPKKPDSIHAPVPSYASATLQSDNAFVRSLKVLEHDPLLLDIQTELAALVNQMVVADQKTITSRSDIEEVVQKAAGYLSIGLERLTENASDVLKNAAVIRSRMLSGIFRVGYGAALDLKWKAQAWVKESWFKAQKLPLIFWGEAWVGVLGGLLVKKPLYFDNYQTGVLYREFRSSEEIAAAGVVLDQIVQFDQMLAPMTEEIDRFILALSSQPGLSYKNLLLTRWAQSHLGLFPENVPMPMDRFASFFHDLFGKADKADAAEPKKIRKAMKISFLHWLSEKTGWSSIELTQRCGLELERLFSELEGELGAVAEGNLDARYIHLFWVESA